MPNKKVIMENEKTAISDYGSVERSVSQEEKDYVRVRASLKASGLDVPISKKEPVVSSSEPTYKYPKLAKVRRGLIVTGRVAFKGLEGTAKQYGRARTYAQKNFNLKQGQSFNPFMPTRLNHKKVKLKDLF